MKKFRPFLVILMLLFSYQFVQSQNIDLQGFGMTGKNPQTIVLNQSFTRTSELFPFQGKAASIFGLAVKADIAFASEKSLVKIILVDKFQNEYLVYESYPLLEDKTSFSIDNLCEETGILNGVNPQTLRIELTDATLSIQSITYSSAPDNGIDVQKVSKEKKVLQNNRKINQINRSISSKGLAWVAGETEVSALSYAEKKKLYGQSTFTPGIEYYVGGIIQTGGDLNLKSATASAMIDNWDWRNRHGKNWVTSIKNQASCGSCWAFAATGATEAQVNLFFNQLLNLNLSEQTLLSCSGAGSCSGGYPSVALDYVKNTGIVNEEAFPYTATDQPCSNKSAYSTQLIKIGGRIDFPSAAYPASEDNLKKMIIKYGPLSGGLYDWSHAMPLVGWQVVKEGDRFYYRDLAKSTYWYTVPAGSALIGKTVWIFKNSWGAWGDGGYVYVETPITNFGWTHALTAPIQSLNQTYTVQCVDNDHDGYYWWGLGAKPANSPVCPDTPDGDDTNALLGPLDSYGNCTLLSAAPVADFTADKTILFENGSVNFTDLSLNAPTSWTWNFTGGTPATSTSSNPTVTYTTEGTYAVTLVISNANGTDTKTKIDYITVNKYVPVFCSTKGNAAKEWIDKVTVNSTTFATLPSSGTAGYMNLTANIFNLSANQSYPITLTPKWTGKASDWCWNVWIDLNQDADFTDAGELVMSASKLKTAFTKNFTIPLSAKTGATRMRVSMKRNTLPLSCEVFPAGEVKDFTVNISAPAAQSLSLKKAGISIQAESSSIGFKLYPNPVDQLLYLNLNELSGNDSFSIYNIQGALMVKKSIVSTISEVDVNNLSSGMYLMTVKNGSQLFQEKFIKK